MRMWHYRLIPALLDLQLKASLLEKEQITELSDTYKQITQEDYVI